MQIIETRVNVTLGGGKAVHTGLRVVQDGVTYKATAECGGNKAGERYRETTAEVTCKRCLKLLAALAEAEAAYQDRLEASMSPATEAHDLDYVAEDRAEAEAAQPADVREVRETARDAAEDARRDAALLRATLKLGAPEQPEAREQCGAAMYDAMTGVLSVCAKEVGHDRSVLNDPADRLHADGQTVRDVAHAEALAYLDRVSIPDAEDLRRDLEAVVAGRDLCTCGHGKHVYGPCYGLTECGCATYVPSGLEGVYDPQTRVWGVRRIGTTVATWLPWTPSRGGMARHARVELARRMAAQRNG